MKRTWNCHCFIFYLEEERNHSSHWGAHRRCWYRPVVKNDGGSRTSPSQNTVHKHDSNKTQPQFSWNKHGRFSRWRKFEVIFWRHHRRKSQRCSVHRYSGEKNSRKCHGPVSRMPHWCLSIWTTHITPPLTLLSIFLTVTIILNLRRGTFPFLWQNNYYCLHLSTLNTILILLNPSNQPLYFFRKIGLWLLT